ncbi:nucleotidyl transferase AbiEii/AbiGii toxin family protein [Candidatus Uhrbacteria bacterium]|nr:nucleotidyl transferase AbiEii/AbiGii toxin family protein [Candidatus Uhrbacteria bacterium]
MARTHKNQVTWHLDALPHKTLKALDFFSKAEWLSTSKWYLAGGTALALQVGHRTSLDLDFFTPAKNFSMNGLTNRFSSTMWETQIAKEATVYGTLLGAKVSFIAYPFFIPREPFIRYGNVRVLSIRDIAVMKIIAISQRGKKRDFYDLYWYIQHCESLLDILRRLPDQYPTVAHDFHHILKALLYFAEAEDDPMPRLFFTSPWKTVKRFFTKEVPLISKELLRLE